jgi:DNA repair protein RecO (recombination protein O)
MPYLRDRVIVLRSDVFREHDRRLVMFGKQHGLLEAVARGASAKQAKQGGHVVPMTEAEVLIAKGSAFDKLAVATLVNPRHAVRRRLGTLAFTGAFFDLFERLQKPGIVDEDLYQLLVDVLSVAEMLPEEPSTERARLFYAAAALKLLDRIGFAPPLSACASCREPFSAEGEGVWLLPVDGSFVCPDCYRDLRRAYPNAQYVPMPILGLLRFMRREPLEKLAVLTGTPETFRQASLTISALLQQTPLSRAPHGSETILALLG